MRVALQRARPANKGYAQRLSLELVTSVVDWFRTNGRDFPWRQTKDPFHILIAEVLLRQTQAPRVVGPYVDLINTYPDPESFATADVNSLRKWFRPLGLIRRADHLIECARSLMREYDGQVPRDLKQLESLPGIGRYSARAILCMAFQRPEPMVDEGSGRVLRRVLGFEATGPAYLDETLLSAVEEVVPLNSGSQFNLGLIDIAAAYCHSRTPHCRECPLLGHCSFRLRSRTNLLMEGGNYGPSTQN